MPTPGWESHCLVDKSDKHKFQRDISYLRLVATIWYGPGSLRTRSGTELEGQAMEMMPEMKIHPDESERTRFHRNDIAHAIYPVSMD
ncbi:uncharacterized protein N7484_001968 [Penicillium longicatenatum]|uniref:uncharacterized protein n=1 Tax=Penicillium longicatenatum TaxID=1561947 RepID=UPI002547420A|nr:uncharacterized protein N7484_001968 [Penicillium longicatenatum]KAJ5658319.1 hypothetical protein N7484_001968 [Penicillium longicatenatum]